jgi:hypothetical protein
MAFVQCVIESTVPAPQDTPVHAPFQETSSGVPPDQPRDWLNNPVVFEDSSRSSSILARVAAASRARSGHYALTGGTVSDCLLCLYYMPLLDAPLGRAGDPVGLCRNCNCMSCGWHGTLTPDPKFICILCDDNRLFLSAARDALSRGGWERLRRRLLVGIRQGTRRGPASDEDAALDLARALASSVSAGGDPRLGTVATLEQWFAERPHYQALMAALQESVNRAVQELDALFGVSSFTPGRRPVVHSWPPSEGPDHDRNGTIRELWVQLGVEGRRLLAAAVLLSMVLHVPRDLLPTPVAHVAGVLSTILSERIPDEIGALGNKITKQQEYRG